MNASHRADGLRGARPVRGETRLPRICLVSYRHLSRLALSVIGEFEGRADIEVVDEIFESALEIARTRERLGLVDAFVSAGANAAMLRGALATPVATIKVDGYDLLLALMKAREVAQRVGVVTYGRTIDELDAAKSLLNLEIEQRAYRTEEEARRGFESLVQAGVGAVVGSSIPVELAERHGLHGVLAYSLAGVRRGLEDAIELARISRLEAARFEQLSGVLHSLQEAVLAVDAYDRVIAVNPPMEVVLGVARQTVLGRALDEIEPELSLREVLASGAEQRSQVIQFAKREWIAHRAPIKDRQAVVGATLTLYDAATIQEADTNLRSQRRGRAVHGARYRFAQLGGASPAFRRAVATAERYARTDLTVLVTGESGTGKEMFAQAIHNASARADRPFVAINCAAFPETLLESELFGHEEGAFTGARRGGKRGLIEAAHTGTLLLDEIGDMPLGLQTRLLRVLQEREVVRLGGTAPIPVDVRVIAATHQPLAHLLRERRFREDLYYRINILQLTLPPLRERREDIVPLAQGLLARSLERLGCDSSAAEVLAPLSLRLSAYGWPGNVRELENVCERMAVFFAQYARAAQIDYAALEADCPELYGTPAVGHAPRAPSAQSAAQQIRDVLAACDGNRQEAARRLGISRATLWRRMQAMSHETREGGA